MPKNRIRFSEDFVLKNNQVGIGTSTPTAKLDVAGDLKVSGIITAPTISIPTFVGVVTIATRSGAATTERMELRTYGVNNGTLAIANARGNLLLSANNIADTDSSEFKINQYLGNLGIVSTRTTFAVNSAGDVSIAGTVTVGSASTNVIIGITTRSNSLNTFDTINIGTGLTNTYPGDPFTKANIIRGSLQLRAPSSNSTQFVNLVPRFLDNGALSFEAPVGSARTNRVTQVFSVSNNFTSTIFRINDLNSNPILEASTSGNIGFGTTNPQKRVHIVGAGASGGLRITSVASTSTEHAEINYYRNIGFTTGIGSTAPGADVTRGALSFEFTGSRFGLSTTSNVQTPLLSLSNSNTDNLFSVAAFTNASFVSGISTLPAIDVTLVGDVGIGTTRPQSGFHINKNIIVTAGIASIVSIASTTSITGIDFYVPYPNRVSYSSSVSTASTQRIYQEIINPGVHSGAPSRRGFYYAGDFISGDNVNGGQHLSILNDNSSLFTVNNFPSMSSARPAPSGLIRNIDTLIDVKSSGNIGFNTTNPVTFIQVGTGTSVISVTGIGSVGIGTTRPTETVDILNGNVRIGINTSNGLILTASNGTKYRIGVNTDGTLFTTVIT